MTQADIATTLSIAGVACPQIQDPAYTYGNPDEALQDSQEQIENTENAIEGFENTGTGRL